MVAPKSNGQSGDHDKRGRFAAGNAAARGRKHPHAEVVAKLRSAMLRAVTAGEVRQVMKRVVQIALEGEPDLALKAATLLFSRTLGDPVPADVLERLEQLEGQLSHEPAITN